jgi:antitoxin PrlF
MWHGWPFSWAELGAQEGKHRANTMLLAALTLHPTWHAGPARRRHLCAAVQAAATTPTATAKCVTGVQKCDTLGRVCSGQLRLAAHRQGPGSSAISHNKKGNIALLFLKQDCPMTALTVTAKGQITLRRELLQFMGIAPGQQIEVDKLANGVLALHAKTPQGLEAFAGCLPPPDKALSVDDMNAVIANGWAGQK